MKKKLILFLIIILLIVPISTKRIKRKKWVFVTALITVGYRILNGIRSIKQGKEREGLIEKYSEHVMKIEGLERLFGKSMTKLCSKASKATVFNSEVLFYMRTAIRALRQRKSESNEKIISDPQQKALILGAIHDEELKEEISVLLDELTFSSLLDGDREGYLSEMEHNLMKTIGLDHHLKNEICLVGAYNKGFIDEKKEAISKMAELGRKIENSRSILQLFSDSSEYRDKILKLKEKYDPLSVEDYKESFRSKPYKIVKGLIKTAMIATPFLGAAGSLLDKASIVMDIYESYWDKTKNALNTVGNTSFSRITAAITNFRRMDNLVQDLFDTDKIINFAVDFGIHVSKKITKYAVKELTSIGTNLTMIAADLVGMATTSEETTNASIDMEDRITDLTLNMDSFTRFSNLKVINLNYNSLEGLNIINRISKRMAENKLNYLEAVNKQICLSNMFLCYSLFGDRYLKDKLEEKVCPRDVFVSTDQETNEKLENNGFERVITDRRNAEFSVYFNYFYSTSTSFVVKVIEKEEDLPLDALKKEYLHTLELISSSVAGLYKIEGDVFPKDEGDLIVTKLNLAEKHIYVITVTEAVLSIYKGFKESQCEKLSNLLSKSPKNPPFPSKPVISQLSSHFLADICQVVKDPFSSFTSSEIEEMREYAEKKLDQFHGLARIKKEKQDYLTTIEELSTKAKFGKAEFNFIDILFISSRMTVKNLIAIKSKNDPHKILISFDLKRAKHARKHIFSRYTDENGYCLAQRILKKPSLDVFSAKEKAKQKEFDKTLTDFAKGISQIDKIYNLKSTFKLETIQLDQYTAEFDTFNVLNEDTFYVEEEKNRIRVKNNKNFNYCTYSISFIEIYVPKEELYLHLSRQNSVGFPIVDMKQGSKGELAFKNRFYVMVSYRYDEIPEKAAEKRRYQLENIERKLAHFGFYNLNGVEPTGFKPVNVMNKFVNIAYRGKMEIKVFVQPIERKENVCSKYNY